MISPLLFLIVLIVFTAAAAGIATSHRRRRTLAIATLARERNFSFAADDPFNLAPHVAAHLPVPGAADVVVRDIIYRLEPAGYRYLFTVEYTVGMMRTKHRKTAAGMMVEKQHCPLIQAYSHVTLGDDKKCLPTQYGELLERFFPDQAGVSAPPAKAIAS